jgi:glycoside/pentoside/hexuronide:cation symporter, GPH family
LLEWLGYIVHADRGDLARSNVADVANSIINMIGTATIIIVILLSPKLSQHCGKKAVAVTGFALTALASAAMYLVAPTNIAGMLIVTVLWSVVYAPTIPLIWAMFADVADYSEWKNNRRATGMVFATICFALKAGLSIGSASLLWLLGMYGYIANQPQTARTLEGIRMCSSVYVGVLFAICTVLLAAYKIDRRLTHQIADELAQRRKQYAMA